LAPRDVTSVIGVVKAYATRVGNGPFPSEITGAEGERLRQLGHEFGATTGRPRRCGWFDAVAVRHAARISGCTELALTKLDVLDGFDRVLIADAYLCEGELLRHFPSDAETLAACTPRYVEAAGWGTPTTSCRRASDLPVAARHYVARVEDLVGAPVRLLSVGPEREATMLWGDSGRSGSAAAMRGPT
jgi:adenylosuccinate synthase